MLRGYDVGATVSCRIVIIGGGVLYFENALTPVNEAGMVVAVVGVSLYNMARSSLPDTKPSGAKPRQFQSVGLDPSRFTPRGAAWEGSTGGSTGSMVNRERSGEDTDIVRLSSFA